MPEIFTDKLTITVGEVQEWWVSFYRNVLLPEFPLSFSNGESSINLKDAMFCFLGSWFYGASRGLGVGNTFQKTNYMVVPLASLGASVIPRLTGHSCTKLSIFQSYGFSSELSLRPHSLRHLSNTLADLSSIPVEIITAWSGRKSSEQTHTYIHTTHDESQSCECDIESARYRQAGYSSRFPRSTDTNHQPAGICHLHRSLYSKS